MEPVDFPIARAALEAAGLDPTSTIVSPRHLGAILSVTTARSAFGKSDFVGYRLIRLGAIATRSVRGKAKKKVTIADLEDFLVSLGARVVARRAAPVAPPQEATATD